MSTVLFKLINGKPVSELVDAVDVDRLLKNGYSTTAESFIDTNKSGRLSSAEVKSAAKKAGIAIGKKTIAQLKSELGL